MRSLPNIVVTLTQAAFLFIMTYGVFILIPTVAEELRTKLWVKEDDMDLYFDKWDIIHWGSALLATLTWPDPKRQRLVAYSGVFVALAFELYEQFYLCRGHGHKESCEPWQDTSKDVLTAVIGIVVALFNPDIVTALGHNETLFWTLATLLLMPHWWWYALILYTCIVVFLSRFYKHPGWLRVLMVGFTSLGGTIRVIQGTISWDTFVSTFVALGGIMMVVITAKLMDKLRPSEDLKEDTQKQQLGLGLEQKRNNKE